MKKLLFPLWLILLLNCESSQIQSNHETINLAWHEYKLNQVNESLVNNSRSNRVRLVVGIPFGHPDYFLGIVEFEKYYLVYEKIAFDNQDTVFQSLGIRIDREKFEKSWNKTLEIVKLVPQKPKIEGLINDDATWSLESWIDSEFVIKTGNLANLAAFIKTIYEFTPFKTPEIVIRYDSLYARNE